MTYKNCWKCKYAQWDFYKNHCDECSEKCGSCGPMFKNWKAMECTLQKEDDDGNVR